MIRTFVILLLFTGWHCASFGQSDTIVSNAVYLEGGGPGIFGSINYERFVYRKKNFGIGVRLGASTLRLMDFRNEFNPDFVIPIAVNFTYGTQHKAEIGIGNSFSNVVHAGDDLTPVRETGMHGNLHIGYRYQPEKTGFFLRAGYTPIFEYFSSVRHWGGLSLGVTF